MLIKQWNSWSWLQRIQMLVFALRKRGLLVGLWNEAYPRDCVDTVGKEADWSQFKANGAPLFYSVHSMTEMITSSTQQSRSVHIQMNPSSGIDKDQRPTPVYLSPSAGVHAGIGHGEGMPKLVAWLNESCFKWHSRAVVQIIFREQPAGATRLQFHSSRPKWLTSSAANTVAR